MVGDQNGIFIYIKIMVNFVLENFFFFLSNFLMNQTCETILPLKNILRRKQMQSANLSNYKKKEKQ